MDTIEKAIGNVKTFSYKKDMVNLSLNLNPDSKTDMEDFKECLEAAQKDLVELIQATVEKK
jgi:uncharacterized UPF0160 family protein